MKQIIYAITLLLGASSFADSIIGRDPLPKCETLNVTCESYQQGIRLDFTALRLIENQFACSAASAHSNSVVTDLSSGSGQPLGDHSILFSAGKKAQSSEYRPYVSHTNSIRETTSGLSIDLGYDLDKATALYSDFSVNHLHIALTYSSGATPEVLAITGGIQGVRSDGSSYSANFTPADCEIR